MEFGVSDVGREEQNKSVYLRSKKETIDEEATFTNKAFTLFYQRNHLLFQIYIFYSTLCRRVHPTSQRKKMWCRFHLLQYVLQKIDVAFLRKMVRYFSAAAGMTELGPEVDELKL